MNASSKNLGRRDFLKGAAALGLAAASSSDVFADKEFRLNYIVASAMYGKLPLDEVLSQVHKCGADTIDIWRLRHADQREQMQQMGMAKSKALLEKRNVELGATTIWGKPFKNELTFLKEFGGKVLVTGFVPKEEPQKFIERLKPQLDVAEELGVTVAIENHGASLDEIRSFAEAARSSHLGVALAPYHLPQDAEAIGALIEDLGPKLVFFYAWQHGMGCHKKLPKEQELLQMPGRGDLDFTPLLAALKKIDYKGWTEIFMHPVPRGIPILPTADRVTQEINHSRAYLEKCLKLA